MTDRAQPQGTVSFLFTDIEGSTRLLHTLGPDEYHAVFARHRRVLRAAVAEHGGYEAGARGDGFFVAFDSAPAAVAAAADAQRALATATPDLRVRMAVHTGEALLDPPDYVGLEVHRAARLMAAAHGGQVLVSDTTRRALPPDVAVRDLGEHWLRDLGAPERLHQLQIDGLDGDFPPPRTLSGPRAALPAQPNRFVGRALELEALGRALAEDGPRVLTLTGPGGSGKTRLAVQLASQSHYPDGVHFVPLVSVTDPRELAPAIALALGLTEDPSRSASELLCSHLARSDALLVLDNLEQVTAGAGVIGGLVAACPRLRVLVTSRTRLRLAAEREYPVPPLAEADAVTLFMERARDVRPDLEADTRVTEICRRVDALPLAVELAAARVGAFSFEQLAQRLERRLPLLSAGPRDAPERHQTLRRSLDWSFDLLAPGEQRLLSRLAVFAGGFTLDAAERVCDADLDALQALVDHSLVQRLGERHSLLQIIREYALERSADPEQDQRRHAGYFLALAEEAVPDLRSASNDRSRLAQLDGERDNHRAALRWLIDQRDGEAAHRLVIALLAFWHDAGPAREARAWVEEVLDLPATPALRAATLSHGSAAASIAGDNESGCRWATQGLELARACGDNGCASIALDVLAYVATTHDDDQTLGLALFEEAIECARRSGDDWVLAIAIACVLANEIVDDPERAAALADEAARLSGVSAATRSLLAQGRGWVAAQAGDTARAAALYRESIRLGDEIGSERVTLPLLSLSWLLLDRDDLPGAREQALEVMDRARASGSSAGLAAALAYLAVLNGLDGDPLRAATLRGAIGAHVRAGGSILVVELARGEIDRRLAPARAAVSEWEWSQAYERGLALSLDDAIDVALAPRQGSRPSHRISTP